MPYQVNRATYGVAPYFVWQTQNAEPAYRHAAMRDYYMHIELPAYQRMRSVNGFVHETAIKLLVIWGFYLGPVLTIPLFAFPWTLRDRRIRWLILAGAVSFTGIAVVRFFIPHYVATITADYHGTRAAGNETSTPMASGRQANWEALVRALVMAVRRADPAARVALGSGRHKKPGVYRPPSGRAL